MLTIEVIEVTDYHILVPIDANEERVRKQVAHVRSLPYSTDSVRATLLHVLPTVGGDAGTERVGHHMGGADLVDDARGRLTDGGIASEYREEEGDVADTILSVAEELDPDLVVVAGRKRTPVGKAIFGSVSQQIILNADCPVTIVK